MNNEVKPIPLNRIKAVLAEKQVSAKRLCEAVGKNETTFFVGVTTKFSLPSLNFKK